jgi:hypothetical protein
MLETSDPGQIGVATAMREPHGCLPHSAFCCGAAKRYHDSTSKESVMANTNNRVRNFFSAAARSIDFAREAQAIYRTRTTSFRPRNNAPAGTARLGRPALGRYKTDTPGASCTRSVGGRGLFFGAM